MTKPNKYEESERFVAQHYERGRFDQASAWKRMGLGSSKSHRWRFAAAASVLAAITVSACIYYMKSYQPMPIAADTETTQTTKTTKPTTATVKSEVIEFNDAPLVDVVAKIEEVYGVHIDNVPNEEYFVTMRYEGTATDLVNTINETLGCNLTITE